MSAPLASAAAAARRPEIVAPAGTPAALRAAVAAGADAVYVGLRHLSARAHAPNFDLAALRAGVAVARARGARVYVALNTLVRDEELETAAGLLSGARDAGAAAVIVQDVALLPLAAAAAPGLPVHASTQMVVHSAAAARLLAAHGVRRAVLARELSLADIRALAADLGPAPLELEVFVQGALCWSVSGLCLLGSLLTGRSGNRGRCPQPCRRSFRAPDGTTGNALSLTDLWGLDALPALAAAGVAALKLEGRLHGPGYVAAAVRTARRARDEGPAAAGRDDRPDAGPRAVRSQFGRRVSAGWLAGPGAPGAARVDPVYQGHRGYPAGRVLRQADGWLHVAATAAFGQGDRLLLDRGDARPYNLPVDRLETERGPVARVAAGETVRLPAPPLDLPPGSEVFLVSAADVKRACAPPPADPPVAPAVVVVVAVGPDRLELDAPDEGLRLPFDLPADPACAPLPAAALRAGLERPEPDQPRLVVRRVEGGPPLLVPPKALGRVRREFLRHVTLERDRRAAPPPAAALALLAAARATVAGGPPPATRDRWTVRVDRAAHLTGAVRGFADRLQLAAAGEDDAWLAPTARWLRAAGHDVEVALPPFVPDAARAGLARTLRAAWDAGVRAFQVGGLGGLGLLEEAGCRGAAFTADHTLPVANPLAWRWLRDTLGLVGATAPAESDAALLVRLAPTLGVVADVLVYADLPLMLGQAPPRLSPGRDLLADAAAATLLDDEERPIRVERAPGGRSVIRADQPLCWTGALAPLRAMGWRQFRVDLVGRRYAPGAIAAILAAARAGEPLPGTQTGNLDRELR